MGGRRSIKRLLGDFCDDTSNTGFYRIGDPRRRLAARILWALLLFLCTIAFAINMGYLLRKFMQYPVYVDTTLQFKTLPFPAVTICNTNPFDESELAASETDLPYYQEAFQAVLQKAGIFRRITEDTDDDGLDIVEMCTKNDGAHKQSAHDMLCNGLDVCDTSGESCQEFSDDEEGYYSDEEYSDEEAKRRRKRATGKKTDEEYYEEYYEELAASKMNNSQKTKVENNDTDAEGIGDSAAENEAAIEKQKDKDSDKEVVDKRRNKTSNRNEKDPTPLESEEGENDDDQVERGTTKAANEAGTGNDEPPEQGVNKGQNDSGTATDTEKETEEAAKKKNKNRTDPTPKESEDGENESEDGEVEAGSENYNKEEAIENVKPTEGLGEEHNGNASDTEEETVEGDNKIGEDEGGGGENEAGGGAEDGGDKRGEGDRVGESEGSGGEHGGGDADPLDGDGKDPKKLQNNLGMMQLVTKSVRDMLFLLQQPDKAEARRKLYTQQEKTKDTFIKECSYNLKRCTSRDFANINTGYYGTCFTFNPNGTTGNTTKPGPLFGLRLLIDVDQEQYIMTTDTAGVKVSIHNPGEYPFPETTAYNAMTQASTSIRMAMIEMVRLGDPYGDCVSANENTKHAPYDYDGSYTVDGCFYTCISRRILSKCNCVHYMYPIPRTSDNKTDEATPYCNTKNRKCAEKEEKDLLNNSTITPAFCGCHELCNQNSYKTTISQTTYPSSNFLYNMRMDGLIKNPEISLVQLEIFYETLNYQRYEEKEAYGRIQLISDFGGQIGLWLGVCVLSMVEFLSLFASLILFLFGCIHRDMELKDTTEPLRDDSSIGTASPSRKDLYPM